MCDVSNDDALVKFYSIALMEHGTEPCQSTILSSKMRMNRKSKRATQQAKEGGQTQMGGQNDSTTRVRMTPLSKQELSTEF